MRQRTEHPKARVLIVSLVAISFVCSLLVPGKTAPMPPSSPAINLDQASNGGIGKTPINPVGWENGNQNGQKAHYNEGESIPYRARITGLTAGQTYKATFGYDITHSSKHAIDFITGRQRIAETVNPCRIDGAPADDVTPCVEGTGATIIAPGGAAGGFFNTLVGLEGVQKVSVFNGNAIANVEYPTQGNEALAQSETTFKVTFTANASTVVLSWGGHIARSADWGPGQAATGISGSPYHTRAKALEVPQGNGFTAISIGNQDRALASSAVQPPSACMLSGDGDRVCGAGFKVHSFQGTVEAGATYSFSITSGNATIRAEGAGTNTNPANGPIQATVDYTGTYAIQLNVSNAAGSQMCSATVTVDQPVTANAGNAQRFCETGGTTYQLLGASSAGPAGSTYSWQVISGPASIVIDSSATTLTPNVSFSAPGTASLRLTVTPPAGSVCTAQTSDVNVTMDDAPEANIAVDSVEHCDNDGTGNVFDLSTLNITDNVPAGGSRKWEITSGTATISDDTALKPTITITSGTTATARLTVSGPAGTQCGDASDSVVLTILPNPTVTITLEDDCDVGLANLKANPSGGAGGGNPANYTYKWFKNDVELAGETSQTLNVTALGRYRVEIKDKSSQSCPASSEVDLCFKIQAVVASARPISDGSATQALAARAEPRRGTLLARFVVGVLSLFA